MQNVLIDNLSDLRESVRECILLYSGGIDSSYFLLWAKQNNIRVTALHVGLDPLEDEKQIRARAEKLGAHCITVDGVDTFANEYIGPAIHAHGLYQNHFPVCSALSRPFMARLAVELAKKEGLSCIVHTSTFVQNSCSRFNNAIRMLGPDLLIAAPFIKEPIRRREKLAALHQAGIDIEDSIYSIDENIWGRVIECGELDDPGYIVPEHVFKWTGSKVRSDTVELAITFENGLPIAIDNKKLSLAEIILMLRKLGGSFRIGRYNGLEDTELGLKNHEVRESPAAAILIAAHMALERAVLNRDEIRIKGLLEAEWTDLVVRGRWYSTLRESLSLFMARLNRLIAGEVVLRLESGSAMVAAVRSQGALHFWNGARAGIDRLYSDFSYREFFEISSYTINHQAGCTHQSERSMDKSTGKVSREIK